MNLRLALSLVAALAGLSLPSSGQTPAANSVSVPPVIQFSNLATDAGGTPLTGTVSITFSLYNNSQGGQALWTETQNVPLDSSGHYSVYLGLTQANGLPADLFISSQAQWLGVKIAGEAEQPRVFLVSVPYAMKAGDATTVGGLPPSAFVMAAPSVSATTSAAADTILSPSPTPQTDGAVTGAGTVDFIPLWDSTSDIVSSVLFQSGTGSAAKVGINTTTPVSTLDIKGGSTVRGTLSLPATGTATSAAGKNSQPVTLAASAFNSSSSTPVNQTFEWQVEPASNDTSTASGTLNLLFGQGTTKPAETGLHIASTGQITFAEGQTFPGAGDGTVTSVATGTGLTGGPITSSGTLQIDPTVVPELAAASNAFAGSITAGGFTGSGAGLTNVNAATLGGFTASAFAPAGTYATLGANTFTGNQTVTGNVSATGVVTGSSFQIGSNPFAFGNYTNANAFLGFAGNSSMTGTSNTASGFDALISNTSGYLNAALGNTALASNTSGYENTALGSLALNFNSSGINNTATGLQALYNNTTGRVNTADGSNSLLTNTTGYYNTGIGNYAGQTADGSNLTGYYNTALGAQVAFGTGSLSNATAIGANAEVTASNALVLGAISGVNGGTSVNVGIGTTAPAYALDVHGTGNFTGAVNFGAPISFASGQTFPGTGTITGVTAGTGLTGGGTSKSVTLALQGAACTPGDALVALGPTSCSPFATLGANTFSASQTVNGNITASETVYAGSLSSSSNINVAESVYAGNVSITNSTVGGNAISATNTATSGNSSAGVFVTSSPAGSAIVAQNTGTGTQAVAVYGTSPGGTGVFGIATSGLDLSYGVTGQSNAWGGVGVLGRGYGLSQSGSYLLTVLGGIATASGVWGDTPQQNVGDNNSAGPVPPAGVLATADQANGLVAVNNAPGNAPFLYPPSPAAVYAYNSYIPPNNEAPPVGVDFWAQGQDVNTDYCLIDNLGDLNCSGVIEGEDFQATRPDGRAAAVYAMSSPEVWYEDFGSGQLANGVANVDMDPVFAQTVNTEVEYHVFLTPRGECEGLYVAEENAKSFEVRELHHGSSNIQFDFRIVAKRKGFENVRLEDWRGKVIRTRARGDRRNGQRSATEFSGLSQR